MCLLCLAGERSEYNALLHQLIQGVPPTILTGRNEDIERSTSDQGMLQRLYRHRLSTSACTRVHAL